MRKGVGISVLVVAALLLGAVVTGRVYVRAEEQRMAALADTLAVRRDSCAEAARLLLGMDSLYRTKMHCDSVLSSAYSDSIAITALSPWLRKTNALSVEAKERARFIPSICPLKEGTFRLTARFGSRTDPIEGDGRMHDGLDLACPQGNPVHVTADGVVEFIDSDIFGYGNCIVVDHGYGYKTRYAHLSIIRTSENIHLKRGDVIGETGVSGRATGPHLHYEVIRDGKTVDPEDYIDIKLSK